MSCVDVEVQLRLYYSGDKPRYEAQVTKIGDRQPDDLLDQEGIDCNWFVADSRDAAIGKLVSSEWATFNLFRNGRQACRFVFKGDVDGRI